MRGGVVVTPRAFALLPAACEPAKVNVFLFSRNGGKGSIVDRAIRQPGGLLRQGVLFFFFFFFFYN